MRQKSENREKKPASVRELIWKIIDTDISLKKDLSKGIINNRALAQHLIEEHKLKLSLDAVISAIRRYEAHPLAHIDSAKAYSLLKRAKITTTTGICSLSLKKNEEVHQKLGVLLPSVNFSAGDILRVLEGAKQFTVLFDQKDFDKLREMFSARNIISSQRKLGMIEMIYPDALGKTPGVFFAITQELASHQISIIDALISSNEHIIIIDEPKVLKAFEAIYQLCQ